LNNINGTPFLFQPYLLFESDPGSESRAFVFGVVRSIIDVKNSKVAGMIQININENVLNNLSRKALSFEGQRILIVDSNNIIVSDTMHDTIGQPFDNEEVFQVVANSDKKYFINIMNIEWADWEIINVVPRSSIDKQINKTIGFTMAAMIILIGFISASAAVIILKLSRPFRKLVENMGRLAKGEFDVNMTNSQIKEMDMIADVFNNMTGELKQFINREYKDELRKKELEIKMLQYQINPHFIYNSLESIKMMSILSDDDESAEMVASLGKLMRYSLTKPNELVEIRQELIMIQEYMNFQTKRLGEQVEFIIEVEDSILSYKIPKLILQPLVENAISHGLQIDSNDGRVIINGSLNGDEVFMYVRNNGHMLQPNIVVKLNKFINTDEEITEHYGIKNINRRIQLYFGNKYGIRILSDEEYTTIEIKLPKFRGSKEVSLF